MLSMLALTEFGGTPSPKEVAKTTAADEVFVLPTTVGQQGFWYLDQLQPGNTAFNIAVRFRLKGPLRVDILERSLQDIVARHEALRTVFAVQDGVPVQVIAPRVLVPLVRDDLLRVGGETERRARAETLAGDEARRRFDLAKGPLIRTRLLQRDDDEHMLLVTIHHIVADGWSIGILTQELAALYDAHCRGTAPAVPELTIQCGDFAIWQEEWMRSQDLNDQIAYWKRQLADLPLLEVATDRPRGPTQTFRGSIESILLSRSLTDELEALSNREKVTTFMVMLASFQILLRHLTSLEDVFVGSVFAGRPRVELESLIGMFINPIVLRTDLSGDPSFTHLLTRVRETVLTGFANQDVPFERVVEAIQPRRDPSRSPVFQINFIFQKDFVRPFEVSGLTLTAIPSVSPGAIYDLNFFMVERADGWRASCEYNTDLYHLASVRRMLGEFREVLELIAAKPAGRVSEFKPKAPEKQATTPSVNGKPVETIPQALIPSEQAKSAYVAPRNLVETQLVEMWEHVLGSHGISVVADFFDLGGHSLLAARLLAQVQRVFEIKLSLAALLEAPTIEALANRIIAQKCMEEADADRLRDGEWKHPEQQLFPMRREGAGIPLIIVDAGPMYRALVRRLENDQPVYGLSLPKWSDLPKAFTAKDIAANLLAALRASGVKGPYCLGGWSMAGVLAYEMAQQLRAEGEEVPLLVLFDSNNPAYLRSFQGWKAAHIRLFLFVKKLLYHRRKIHHMSLLSAWKVIRERARKFDLIAPAKAPLPLNIEDEKNVEQFFQYSWQVQYHAATHYTPKPYDMPLVLLRSEALQNGLFRDPHLGWSKVADGGMHLFEMPGEHDHMFLEPYVQRLADSLKKCLVRANKQFGPPT